MLHVSYKEKNEGKPDIEVDSTPVTIRQVILLGPVSKTVSLLLYQDKVKEQWAVQWAGRWAFCC